MLWIAITSPSFHDGEASFINMMLSHGVDMVHLRKPDASEEDCAALLEALPADVRSRMVIHDFFELAGHYGLHGIHLNARRPAVPSWYTGHVSRSCHCFDEVKIWKQSCDYVFLSPIFDSISKPGYGAAYNEKEITEAAAAGVIDRKVVALGGVTPEKLPYLNRLGFGGAAMLGCVNSLRGLPDNEAAARLEDIRSRFKENT